MYEAEANKSCEAGDHIPLAVRARFQECKESVLSRSVLPWSEHCTECVWPTCYTTCDLYSPRADGRCRRFAEGMVRVECAEAINSYLLKIHFKRWAKLWTPGSIQLHSSQDALRREKDDYKIGSVIQGLYAPEFLKTFVVKKRYSFKKKVASRTAHSELLPTAFVVEVYNPGAQDVSLSLTMRAVDQKIRIPYQRLLNLQPGFHRIRIPYSEIGQFLDLRLPFGVELTPNEDQLETVLYFGLMEFVHEQAAPAPERAAGPIQTVKVKCVVWDLDNTLWNGILIEDGAEKIALKPEIREIIDALDKRGILQSIASKNNHDEALAALKRFGLDQFFLHPEISWGPKSAAVRAIGQHLNIGLDTILFVDDSEFELQEVQMTLPEVRTLNALNYRGIPDMEACKVPVTRESAERRKMYQVESERQAVAESFEGDYSEFLRYCNIRLTVEPLTESNLKRVHELTQRTNQMNFSGNRYSEDVLRSVLSDSHLDTYVLSVQDRFGAYGIVGFSIVDRRTPLMTDLMFSCRVQSKRVEHAFLAYVIKKYIGATGKDFYANYKKTSRNEHSGKVFDDLSMKEESLNDGILRLVFSRDWPLPEEPAIDIEALESVEIGR
jgi:FkbH-like protein